MTLTENGNIERAARRDFASVDTWIFDLDNTLYPPECDLFAQVDLRMTEFISSYLGVDAVEAKRIQKDFYIEHGTTLAGLMTVHGLEPTEFLDYVHDIDVSAVLADAPLGHAIDALPGRKIVFTNGSLAHAENVIRQLGIGHVFEGIFDIVSTEYEPKPRQRAYERFLAASGIEPTRAAMFEDLARNLEVPHALGMATVWVRPPITGPERHHALSHEGADGPHVHYVTDNLREFLEELVLPSATAE